MQNYKAEIITGRVFNVKANTVQEAMDFILHAYFKTDMVDANTENIEYVNFSCFSENETDKSEYMAIRNGNSFEVVDMSKLHFNQ
ncbi:hypothetical protein FMM68_00150 [Lachnospiraceae bacterium MD329]|nr:hypothetical protein [Lachnospiraceae bacterium MD329]